ncbi:MAG: hypothetical protein KDA84_23225 [Planctomycetaceae bacterium]|nr:hypothetical protein [Planctomycetaceae bacterium]
MQNLPKLSSFPFTILLLTLGIGAAALMGFPVGAQEDPAPDKSAENANPTAEKPEANKDAKPSEKPAEPIKPSPEAAKLFSAAGEKLPNRNYRASIVQRMTFSDRTLEAKGKILRGQKRRLRLEFEIKTGGTVGKLLQVCNGEKLWTERRINDVTRLAVQDVEEILDKAGVKENDVDRRNLIVAEMGLGGITGLLASLERTMNFGQPEKVVIDGEELYRVDGGWNEEFTTEMMGNPQLAKGLPEYIPDGARVYFDGDDFPRRIQYLKKVQGLDAMRPLVTLDFMDVEWLSDAEVKPDDFKYTLPDRVYPEDVTKNYVDLLNGNRPGGAPKP